MYIWLPQCDSYHIISWPVSINRCCSLTSVKLTDNSNGSFSAPLYIVHSLYCIIYKNIQIFFCKTFFPCCSNGMRSRIHILSASFLLPSSFPFTAFQRSVAATLNKSHGTRRSLTTTDFHNKLPWLLQEVEKKERVEERTKHTQKRWWVAVNGRGDGKNNLYCNRPEQCASVTPRQPTRGRLNPVYLPG